MGTRGDQVTSFRSVNPHRPTDVVFELQEAGPAGVDRAIARAREGLLVWKATSAFERGKALAAIADDLEHRAAELSDLIVREVGKPIVEARAEVARAVGIFRYYSQIVLLAEGEVFPPSEIGTWLASRRYPVGVCGLITPWNFPVAIPSWKAAPALGYGNAVIFKPAPPASATGAALTESMSRHVPEGVVSVVMGGAETGRAMVAAVDAVSFTGSHAAGLEVARTAAQRGARSQCEMGGQNPSIVLADADLGNAARVIATAAMGYAGQKCTATSRVIIESAVYGPFVERLVDAVEGLEVVDPRKESCAVGPVISAEARSRAQAAVAASTGRILAGGSEPDVEGYYLAPTLVELDDRATPVGSEEVFAPVAGVIRVRDAEEAGRVADEVSFGLVAAVFTNDLGRALKLMDRLDTGLIRVNAPTTGVDFHAPFGGTKGSGLGPKEQGLAAREFYTQIRTLLVTS